MGDLYAGSVNRSLIDIFGSYTDFILFYLQRRSEESFLDTARLDSTFLGWANNFGYSARRPVSSKGRVRVTVADYADETQLAGHKRPTQNKFTFDWNPQIKLDFEGKPFIFYDRKRDSISDTLEMEHNAAATIINSEQEEAYGGLIGNKEFEWGQPITFDLDVMQGEFAYKTTSLSDMKVDSKLSELFGAQPEDDIDNLRFLYYVVNDPEFSNYFGGSYNHLNPGKDPKNQKLTGEFDQFTKVWVNTNPEIETEAPEEIEEFIINRHSIFERFRDSNFVVTDPETLKKRMSNFCLIKNRKDKGVEISFFDRLNESSKVNTENRYVNVINRANYFHLKYFKSQGKAGNVHGKIGKEIDFLPALLEAMRINGFSMKDAKADVKVMWISDSLGGSDFESQSNIKLNTTGFKNLSKSLGKKDDFKYVFRDIENFNVWGEQDEIEKDPKRPLAKKAYAGVVLYSTVERIYDIYNDSPDAQHSLNLNLENSLTITDNSLDFKNPQTMLAYPLNYDKSLGGFQYWFFENFPDRYLDIKEPGGYFSAQTAFFQDNNLVNANGDIRRQMVIGSIPAYMYPVIQYFELVGNVRVNSFDYSVQESKRRINNAIYEHLSRNVGFNTPIYKSDIERIISSFPEVTSFEINLVPLHNQGISFNPDDFNFFSRVYLMTLAGKIPGNVLEQANNIAKEELIKWLTDEDLGAITAGRDLSSRFEDVTKDPMSPERIIPVSNNERSIRKNINERSYWDKLGNVLVERMTNLFKAENLITSADGQNLPWYVAREMNISVKKYIQEGMFNLNNDIVNFSLNNEIAAVVMDREIKTTSLAPSQYSLVYIQDRG